MVLFGLTLRYLWFAVPVTGFLIGKFLDDEETLRLTMYRDKSCLYGGNVKEGCPPTWPRDTWPFVSKLFKKKEE